MAKRIKITESQFNELFKEFVGTDGSLVDGSERNTDNLVKTNKYRESGRPETTDDFMKSTGQDSKWYFYRGYGGVFENVQGDYIKTGDMMVRQDESSIPDPTELSKSYERPDLEEDLSNIAEKLANLHSRPEQEQDIKAIILKEILTVVNVNDLKPQHQEEIKNMLR